MVRAFTNTAITAKGFKSAMSEVNICLHREEAKLLPLRAATNFFPTEIVHVVFVTVVMKLAKGSSVSLSAGVAALPRQISATSVTSCVSSYQVLLGREGKTTLHLSKCPAGFSGPEGQRMGAWCADRVQKEAGGAVCCRNRAGSLSFSLLWQGLTLSPDINHPTCFWDPLIDGGSLL